MGKKNTTDTIDKVNRTEENSLDNSTVELWLHKDYLDATIDDYVTIKGVLDGWQELAQSGKKDLEDSSDGDASQALTFAEDLHNCTEYAELKHKTVSATQTMRLASDMANKLLLRCENFYEILQGLEEYEEQDMPTAGVSVYFSPNVATQKTPMCSELYLNKAYYGEGGGSLSTDTEDAVSNYKNISTQKDELVELLSHLKVRKLDISAECEAIEDDCKKRVRLTKLYKAFCDYVLGINNFNTTISDDFSKIIVTANAFDNTRTYEYPEIDPEEENMILNAVLMAELHEMGLTDEEIKKATQKSSFTLRELAATVEIIHAEDKLYNNGGTEIQLFKSVLSGNAKDAYNKYSEKIGDKGLECWCGISRYIMGTVAVGYNKDGSIEIKDKEEYKNQMNAILRTKNPAKLLGYLKVGSAVNAYISNQRACVISNDSTGYSNIYLNYKKDMVVSDTFEYLEDMTGNQHNILHTHKFLIDDVNIDEDGNMILSMRDRDQINGGYDNWDDVPESGLDRKFTLTSKYLYGVDEISDAVSNADSYEKLRKAEIERSKNISKAIRSGVGLAGYAGGYFVGSPEGGAFVATAIYDTVDASGNAKLDDLVYKEYVDTAVTKTMTIGDKYLDTDSKLVQGGYGYFSKTAFNTYKVFSDDSIEKAEKGISDLIAAKYTGSAGACEIKYDDEPILDAEDKPVDYTKYAVLHANSVAPEYIDSFNDISKESTIVFNRGVSGVGKWDQKFTDDVKGEVEKIVNDKNGLYRAYSDAEKKQMIEDCNKILDGGYDVNKMMDPNKNKVVPTEFNIMNKAFENSYEKGENGGDLQGHIPELGQANEKNVVNDLWAKQGDDCGKWMDERDTRWWND